MANSNHTEKKEASLLNQLTLQKIDKHQSEPFLNLQQLYEFEFSPLTGYELEANGRYNPELPQSFWSKAGVEIYVLHHKQLPIGFTVVNLSGMIDNDTNKKDIAEFFVMPSFRRQGVGEWMASRIFKLYPGKWEVRQLADLEGGKKFWQRVINKFTAGEFKEVTIANKDWQGTMQSFVSK